MEISFVIMELTLFLRNDDSASAEDNGVAQSGRNNANGVTQNDAINTNENKYLIVSPV